MANTVIKDCGFHHLAFRASDFDRSLRFYTRALGFRPTIEWGEGDGRGALLDIGDGGCLELFGGGTGQNEGMYFHIAYKTSDVDGAFAAAIAGGAVADRQPTDIEFNAKQGKIPARIAFVKGPDGETIEFFSFK